MSLVYTRERLDHALRLKRAGMTWDFIGERLGVSPTGLKSTACRYRAGKLTFTLEERRAETVLIEEMVERGVRNCEIGRRFGLSDSAVCNRLDRIGLDARERAAIRLNAQMKRAA